MRSLSFLAWIASSAAHTTNLDSSKESRSRKDLSSVGFDHFGSGVQFKIQHRDQKLRLRREEDEISRITRIVDSVSKVVSHLTAGVKPHRVFQHAGANQIEMTYIYEYRAGAFFETHINTSSS